MSPFIETLYRINRLAYKNNITVTCCKGIRISDFSLKECDKIDMINYAKLCTDIHIDRFL